MTAALLDPPAVAPAPAPAPSLRWQTAPDSVRVGSDGRGGSSAQLVCYAHGFADALTGASASVVAELLDGPLRREVAGLSSVCRYGALLLESSAVRGEVHALDASLRRAHAERDETVALARPGFSAGLAELDREIGDLSARRADADARLTAVSGPLEQARSLAMRDAEGFRLKANADAARQLYERRVRLAALIGPTIGPVLTEILGLEHAIHGCSVGMFGRDVTGRLDELAGEAVGG